MSNDGTTYFYIDTPTGEEIDGKKILKRETSNGRDIVNVEYIVEGVDE